MKDKTLKLQRVENTLKICKEMADVYKQREKEWTERGCNSNAFASHMLVGAYEFIAHLLEEDLKDN